MTCTVALVSAARVVVFATTVPMANLVVIAFAAAVPVVGISVLMFGSIVVSPVITAAVVTSVSSAVMVRVIVMRVVVVSLVGAGTAVACTPARAVVPAPWSAMVGVRVVLTGLVMVGLTVAHVVDAGIVVAVRYGRRRLACGSDECRVATVECGGHLFLFLDDNPGFRRWDGAPERFSPLVLHGVGIAHDHQQIRIRRSLDEPPSSAQQFLFDGQPCLRRPRACRQQHARVAYGCAGERGSQVHRNAPSRQAYPIPARSTPRNRNISMTALVPTSVTTFVQGYMNSISMSKARKIIVIGYQRTWNRDIGCSAGSRPPLNGPDCSGSRVVISTAPAP
jgi:hypothetical protein